MLTRDKLRLLIVCPCSSSNGISWEPSATSVSSSASATGVYFKVRVTILWVVTLFTLGCPSKATIASSSDPFSYIIMYTHSNVIIKYNFEKMHARSVFLFFGQNCAFSALSHHDPCGTKAVSVT